MKASRGEKKKSREPMKKITNKASEELRQPSGHIKIKEKPLEQKTRRAGTREARKQRQKKGRNQ